MSRWLFLSLGLVVVGCGGDELPPLGSAAAAVTVTGFSSGVTAQNHPAGAGQYGVWYDAADNTFGTPSASTLEAAPAMRIDDGGFANGVYAIFPAAIPSTGTWRLQAKMQVMETGAVDAIDAYQMGAAVGPGAVHRGPNPSLVAALPIAGAYPGLTSANDTALGAQQVVTSDFVAQAGDDLLLAFGTDVGSGTWTTGLADLERSHVLVGDVELVAVAVDPVLVIDTIMARRSSPTRRLSQGGRTATPRHLPIRHRRQPGEPRPGRRRRARLLGSAGHRRSGANSAQQPPYTVRLDGTPVLHKAVDQRLQDLTWVKLGLVEATAPAAAAVTLDAAASAPAGQVVIADAVRFVPSDGPPPVDPPEIRLAAITVFDPIGDVGAIQTTVDRLADLTTTPSPSTARYRGDATYFPNKVVADQPNSEPRTRRPAESTCWRSS